MRSTLIWLILAAVCSAEEPLYESEFIFEPSAERHGHVHASSIVECPDGALRVVWYENGPSLPSPRYNDSARDKSDNVRIAGSRKAKAAASWEAPFVMSDTFGLADNNPALAIDGQGKLWLFHSTMLGAPKWTWGSALVRFRISSDYQRPGPPRWEKSELLIPRPLGIGQVVKRMVQRLSSPEVQSAYGLSSAEADSFLDRMRESAEDPMKLRFGWMPRAHPLIRSDGALVLPLSNENFEIPMMAITADEGDTWTYSHPVPAMGLLQPSLVEFPQGAMAAYFRNGDPRRRIQRSVSTDGGLTWSPPELTDRPHPGGGVEALLLKSGSLALVYNNKQVKPRDKLAISLSDDRGRTWKWTRQLEDAPGGRFDYPSIIQARDGAIHVTYSHRLQTIKHVRLNEAWVKQGNGQ